MTTAAERAQIIQGMERLLVRVEDLSDKVDKRSAEDAKKPESPKAWWENAIQFLGLPVVLLGLALTFNQIRTEQTAGPLNSAETAKAQADTSKAVAETAKLNFELTQIQQRQASGRRIDLEEIDKLIPRLKRELSQSVDQQSRYRASGSGLIMKYIMLTLAWWSIAVLIAPFALIWGSLISGGYQLLMNTQPRYGDQRPGESHEDFEKRHTARRKRWDRIDRWWRYATLLLNPVPSVLDWSLRILLFGAVAIPLFDQTTALLGSPTHFAQIAGRVAALDISSAIAMLRDLIIA